MFAIPPRVEDIDPDFGELLKQIARKEHPLIRGMTIRRGHKTTFVLNSGATATATGLGRNDPCLCGSGRKYKRCCGG